MLLHFVGKPPSPETKSAEACCRICGSHNTTRATLTQRLRRTLPSNVLAPQPKSTTINTGLLCATMQYASVNCRLTPQAVRWRAIHAMLSTTSQAEEQTVDALMHASRESGGSATTTCIQHSQVLTTTWQASHACLYK
jgi:hypothetical protein